jgi:hypothetical protein
MQTKPFVVKVVFGLYHIDLENELLCHIDLVNVLACIFNLESKAPLYKSQAQLLCNMREFYVVFLSENVDHKKWWDVLNKKKLNFKYNIRCKSLDNNVKLY